MARREVWLAAASWYSRRYGEAREDVSAESSAAPIEVDNAAREGVRSDIP
jgi:hypothetical protein